MREIPGFAAKVEEVASHVLEVQRYGQQLYKEAHWGRPGRDRSQVTGIPTVDDGLVVLGRLHSIEYLTQKGRERLPAIYVHTFEPARSPSKWPLLCFAANGSGLVIARGESRYHVTAHGIEG